MIASRAKTSVGVLGLLISVFIILQANALTVFSTPYCSISSFTPPERYVLASFNAASIASGDFNGDGGPDIVVGASAGGGMAVMMNDGTGRFGAASIYPVPAVFTDISTGDFNNDGNLDIAGANQDIVGSVVVLLGTGTGSLGSPIVSPSGGQVPNILRLESSTVTITST